MHFPQQHRAQQQMIGLIFQAEDDEVKGTLLC